MGIPRPWYVEYARPDGWWFLASYSTKERAEECKAMMEARDRPPAGVRVRHRDDMSMEKPMTKY